MVRFVSFLNPTTQTVPDGTPTGAVLRLVENATESDVPKSVAASWGALLLGDISTDDLSTVDRARIRSALALVESSTVIKGTLADDRAKIAYYNGALYGVRRLLYKDVSSTNQRVGYEMSGAGEAGVLNGTGSGNLDNASNQWVSYLFTARNVFSIKCRHTNNNWAVRKLVINAATKNLSSGSGAYTYVYTPASGWQSIYKVQFVDDGGSTTLNDLQVLYADPTFPTLTNGDKLEIGDVFQVSGAAQLLRFEGVDTASGAWKATPVTNQISLDSQLDPLSTRGIENQAVYWAIDDIRQELAIIDEIREGIALQIELNTVLIDQIAALKNAGAPSTSVDLKPVTDRLTALESEMGRINTRLNALGASLLNLTNRSNYVQSPYSPSEVDMGRDWRIWLQEGVINSREYSAVYVRSVARYAAIKIWESIGAIVATPNQDQTYTYTGIPGVSIRYKPTRNADLTYSIWVTATQGLTDNQVPWIALDEAGVEVDQGLITSIGGEEHIYSPRIQTRSIRLILDWVDSAIADDTYTFGVS